MTAREKILALVADNPDITRPELVKAVGSSQQNVYRIVAEEKLQLPSAQIYHGAVCSSCGNRIGNYQKTKGPHRCRPCRRLLNPPISFNCEVCGQSFSVEARIVKYLKSTGRGLPRFGSNQCQGKWLGKTFTRRAARPS